MSKIVKLLIAVLVLGFLVGCGGGGGSSSPSGNNTNSTIIAADPNITLASISSGFPVFDDSSETVDYMSSANYYYPVSASQNSTFFGALAGKGFSVGGSYYYSKIDTDYYAYAEFYPDKINLILISLTIPHTDAQYASIFGDPNADVDSAFIYKEYIGDLTAKFNAYRDLLVANGWTDTSYSGVWKAEKIIGSLTYEWRAAYDGTYSESQWGIK